jgi:hypothetical protein
VVSAAIVAKQSLKMTLYCGVMVPVRGFNTSGTVLAWRWLVPTS